MLELHCKNCNDKICTSDFLAFYQQSSTSFHLIIKLEKRNQALTNLKLIQTEKAKERKFKPFVVFCKNESRCGNKLGGDLLIGPKAEAILCFKSESFYFIDEHGKRSEFDMNKKFIENMKAYPSVELKTIENFYENTLESKLLIQERTDFIHNKFPTLNELLEFNIGTLISDIPRTYQVELYIQCLLNNTICYLPTGSGKTMIAAMICSHMKQLNPNKKIFFVCDRIPLVYQQASYLRYQCGLNVGEFCGQNRELFTNQLDPYDILVFTAEFLINKLFNKTLYMQDCCCLIIDEIHHANQGEHSFKRLINNYCDEIQNYQTRPRIIGLTASPSSKSNSSKMIDELHFLNRLINGTIQMPRICLSDMRLVVNRPQMKFVLVNNEDINDFIRCLNVFIQPFIVQLYSQQITLDLRTLNNFKGLIRNTVNESHIQINQKKFQLSNFIEKIINSIEILTIIGQEAAVDYINAFVAKEKSNNLKNRMWKEADICNMNDLLVSTKQFNQTSLKIQSLMALLKEENELSTTRSIIFVRTRKTARILVDYLNRDTEIQRKLSPKLFVGHANGTLDGMSWLDEQKPTIDNFYEGNCKLLVSTNVLQEGLDVPDCDKIIFFDPMVNTTEYVQSRGRARKVNSEFVVIGTRLEEQNYLNLMQTEHNLDLLINQLMRPTIALTKDHIDRIIRLINSADRRDRINETLSTPRKLRNFKFTLKLFIRQDDHSIQELFKKLKLLKGYSNYEQIKDCYLNEDLFNENRKVFNVQFKTSLKYNTNDDYEYVMQTVNSLLNDNQLVVYLFPFNQNEMTNSNLTLIGKNLSFGYLPTPLTFILDSRFNSLNDIKMIVDFNEKIIKLLFYLNNNLFKFEIPFDSISSIICYDYDCIYVPCNRAPLVYVTGDDETRKRGNLVTFDEKHLNWERERIEFNSWTFKIEIDKNDRFNLLDCLQCLKSIRTIFVDVETMPLEMSLDKFKTHLNWNDFDNYYATECFLSQNGHLLVGKINENFVNLLKNNVDRQLIPSLFERLTLKLQQKRFHCINYLLEDILPSLNAHNKVDNSNIVYIRRATVTPNRIVFYYQEPFFSNRVIRKYNADCFLRIKFRDEDFHKLNRSLNFSDMTAVYNRILNLLFKGLHISNRKYEFLAMSSSQMREHGCWLFCELLQGVNADAVRKWMGNFANIKCIGKYAARLGQSLSSSIESFESNKFKLIDDLTVTTYEPTTNTHEKYCFTDGIGKISLIKAKEICSKYYSIEYASAFQIRFAGFKGVVAIDPHMQHDELQFRASMNKFDSVYNRLDVLNIAEYIPCYLNRQIIMILSTLGITDNVFNCLQDQMLKELTSMLTDQKIASKYLTRFYRPVYAYASNTTRLDYTSEAYFRDLLRTIFFKEIKNLIEKSRIFVKNGRILMGTIDETGSLGEDEVFIQVTNIIDPDDDLNTITDQKHKIIESQVAVAKNPCMHAGDVRVLNSVKCAQLTHMVDCIVFPCKGKRPITNMCSGSDLDGDLYFVTWEPLLIPKKQEDPLVYVSMDAQNIDTPITINNVIQFFVKFIEVDQLGRLANAHVAIADSSTHGVKDKRCIELAKLFSQAVDFPKTGFVPEFPKDLKNLKYPDFMMKTMNCYESNKIIGKMFRKCKSISTNELDYDELSMNESFLINGFDTYLNEANDLYLKYRNEIERLLIYFDCKTESQLFIGVALDSSKSDDSRQMYRLSVSIIKQLWDFFRELFFKEFNIESKSFINVPKSAFQKASAWYYVCYSSVLNKKQRILSFPWIVEDVFNHFNFIRQKDLLSESIIRMYRSNRENNQMISTFIEYTRIANDISRIIGHDLVLIGSYGLFLFENTSNINLNFVMANPKIDVNIEMSELLEDYFDSVTINGNVINCDLVDNVSFTIYSSKIALDRFLWSRELIFKQPVLLVVLHVIVHFARSDNLFAKLNSEKIKFDLYLEYCVQFMIKNKLIVDTKKEMSLLNEIDLWNEVNDTLDSIKDNNCGKILLTLYRYLAFESNFQFESKFDSSIKINLQQSTIDILKNHFFKVFILLSKTLDISRVWSSVNDHYEPTFKKQFGLMKKRGISKLIFAENASLLLFSNYKSNFDHIEFELYNGKKRSLHINKQCYSMILPSNETNETFSNECYVKFMSHSLQQIVKAKEMQSDFSFRFQLKFGNVYLTNLPQILVQDSSSVALYKLMEALKRGYKVYDWSFHKDLLNSDSFANNDETDVDDNMHDESQERPPKIQKSVNFDENKDQSKKKKKKSKKITENALTAFDSNLTIDETQLNSIFIKHEFDSKISENYIVYVELINSKSSKTSAFRIKYNSNFDLVRVESMPIKWLAIDVRNQSKKENARDVRFSLLSEKEIYANNLDTSVRCVFEKCVIKKRDESNTIVVDENYRHLANVYVRHSKAIKYYGGIEYWKPIFNKAKVNVPDNFPIKWLDSIKIAILNSNEFSENDTDGLFKFFANRIELQFTLNVDINTLKCTECKEIVDVMWLIAKAFANILY